MPSLTTRRTRTAGFHQLFVVEAPPGNRTLFIYERKELNFPDAESVLPPLPGYRLIRIRVFWGVFLNVGIAAAVPRTAVAGD